MRELKLKVWDTVKQKMFNPQGITFDVNSQAPFAIKVSGRSWEPVGKFEIIQWTGLCDASGNYVYEGDFIRISSVLYMAVWNEAEALFELQELNGTEKRSIIDVMHGDITGNKFENTAK